MRSELLEILRAGVGDDPARQKMFAIIEMAFEVCPNTPEVFGAMVGSLTTFVLMLPSSVKLLRMAIASLESTIADAELAEAKARSLRSENAS